MLGRGKSAPPRGEAALRLWAAVSAWREFPSLYELQRPKTAADERRIVEAFEPYLAGRDWVSVNRGTIVDFGRPDDGRSGRSGA